MVVGSSANTLFGKMCCIRTSNAVKIRAILTGLFKVRLKKSDPIFSMAKFSIS